MQRRDALSLLAASSISFAGIGLKSALAKGADARYPRARAYLGDLIADGQFNGVALKIHREGSPPFTHVAGWMDSERQRVMTADAICQMASMTKPITGVSTLILVEQGRLHLDDAVDHWLPELANRKVLRKPDGPVDDTYPAPRAITVRDLLSFRCGYGGDGARGPINAAMRAASTGDVTTIDPDAFLKALTRKSHR